MKREVSIWLVVFVLGAGYLAYRTFSGDMASVYVVNQGGVDQRVAPSESLTGTARVSISDTIGIWVAALFTLFILSFMYRDNPCYKFAEAVVIGVSAAYAMVVGFWTVLVPNLIGPLFPELVQSWAMPGVSPHRSNTWYLYLIPAILGVMLLWRLMPFGTWISRWPLAFVIGATAGLRLVAYLSADFISQIGASLIPLTEEINGRIWPDATNILLVLSILACLVYFFFSFEHKGAVGGVSRIGIWVLMITFGAVFGYTVMGRIALLAIRFEFLFDDWLWLIDPTSRRIGL